MSEVCKPQSGTIYTRDEAMLIVEMFEDDMYGRNGSDQLGWASLVLLLVLNTVNLFVKYSSETVHTILSTVVFLLMVWILFRMFSRNLPKRRRENAWFLAKVVNPIKNGRARSADKEHKYFTCPNCRTVCRVPRGKGKIIITCPKCGTAIHGKS